MKKFNVKRLKLIVNCVIAVLFTVSVLFNLFIMSIFEISDATSFKQAILAKELLDGFNSVTPDTIIRDDDVSEEDTIVEEITTENPTDTEEIVEKDDSIIHNIPPIYLDENVKIFYLKEVDSDFGLAYEFKIKNTSDKPITVEFSDIYIDGFKVELSGLCCKDLKIGEETKAVFTLIQSEWEDFTAAPSKVEFRVKLTNPKSLLTIYESERITLDL